MELVFQENKIEYLRRILGETVSQEQTADLIVPDSYPDAERVVDAFGTVLVRGQECAGGSASVTGMVQAGVLYVSQDGQLRQVQTQVPFTVRREFDAQQGNTVMQCHCCLRGVDARILNSRKLLVRVSVSCELEVYTQDVYSCYDMTEPAPTLQLKRVCLPLQMPVASGEKNFVLNEELELPSGKPEIVHLLKCLYRTQIQEQRMVGNKAVFKGNLLIHALYESIEQELCCHEWTVPFSQYAEMGSHLDECELRIRLNLTGADTEPDSQLDSHRLLTSVNIQAYCVALGTQEVTIVEDAFCTDGELEPQWRDGRMHGILDRQTFRETVTAQEELPAKNIVDTWIWAEEATKQRNGAQVRLRLPLGCNILYYDTNGELQGTTVRCEAVLDTELSENGQCSIVDLELGDIFCTSGNGSLSLRVPLGIAVESTAEHSLHGVCGGEITPYGKAMEVKPAVILRFTQGEESIWQIAKSCRTTVQDILTANDLQQETVPENTLLLIPMR